MAHFAKHLRHASPLIPAAILQRPGYVSSAPVALSPSSPGARSVVRRQLRAGRRAAFVRVQKRARASIPRANAGRIASAIICMAPARDVRALALKGDALRATGAIRAHPRDSDL